MKSIWKWSWIVAPLAFWACHSPMSPSAEGHPESSLLDRLLYADSDECYEGEKGCDLRPLDMGEVDMVAEAHDIWTQNGCGELSSDPWWEPGWGDKMEMWDGEVYRMGGVLLFGDHHGESNPGHEDHIHIWSGVENFAETLAHEIMERNPQYDDWSESQINQRAEECSGEAAD